MRPGADAPEVATLGDAPAAILPAVNGSVVSGAELPEALRRTSAFPPPAPHAVSLATTHASWVFLTEREVWKVKRPVSFGFLDYSDAEKRRRACEDEARLGARLAAEVYLGVAPVYRGPGGLSFVGPGEIVDHAVRMRRLADADSALALGREGRLTPAHLESLAARLAAFYAQAPVTPELGHPDVFAANVVENHQQCLPYAGRFVDAEALAQLFHWQEGALAAATPLLHERLGEQRIREGHGDLRLEHVYFVDGAPDRALVIDPIEFNRRFRCLDVALDVAFLAMELEDRGQRPLAAFFLSRFARDTGDYGFYGLLDLYLSYRAWVRAKVACFVAGDPSTAPDKAQRKAAEAERLFALAASYMRPPPVCQHVIAVGGMIGSGKSTVADALTLELGLPAVSSDATRKSLHGLAPTERGDESLYSDEATRRTYAEVLRRAERVLGSGRGVILDATFGSPAARAAARELARAKGRPFLFVEVTCDEATVRARLRARDAGPSVSDAREDLFARAASLHRPAEELPDEERLVVEGRGSPAGCAHAVRRRVG
jgi:aminoglycoside phosphotransferase family enzyme/predicted kinase